MAAPYPEQVLPDGDFEGEAPRGGGPRPRGTWWREAPVPAVAFVLCLLGAVVRVDDTLAPPPAVAYVIAVLSCAVLPLRHRAPMATLAVTTASGVLVQPLGLLLSPLTAAPAVIAVYSCALTARSERRAAGAVPLASAVLLAASTPLVGDLSWQDASRMGSVAAFPLVAGLLGHSVRNRRACLAAVEERARRAEESRDSEARMRVAEERVRIARELHDLVAHQITLANAQATVAAHLFDTRPEQTRKSLGELVETTRHALDELRATVGLLRQTGDAASPDGPAPGLARLPTLLESFRRAGLEVSVRQEGTARPLPPGVDLTAYRIVQEALTNVTKHAGTGSARVCLSWNPDRVTVTVTDDGSEDGARGAGGEGTRGAPGASARSGATPGRGAAARQDAPPVPQRPPGYGLIGMRERAGALGGHLRAGRRPEGGFLVSARLPLPPAGDTARGEEAPAPAERRTGDGATEDDVTDGVRTGDAETGDAR